MPCGPVEQHDRADRETAVPTVRSSLQTAEIPSRWRRPPCAAPAVADDARQPHDRRRAVVDAVDARRPAAKAAHYTRYSGSTGGPSPRDVGEQAGEPQQTPCGDRSPAPACEQARWPRRTAAELDTCTRPTNGVAPTTTARRSPRPRLRERNRSAGALDVQTWRLLDVARTVAASARVAGRDVLAILGALLVSYGQPRHSPPAREPPVLRRLAEAECSWTRPSPRWSTSAAASRDEAESAQIDLLGLTTRARLLASLMSSPR